MGNWLHVFSFRSLPIVRCWRNGAYTYAMEKNGSKTTPPFLSCWPLTLSLSLCSHMILIIAQAQGPLLQIFLDFFFLLLLSPGWFRFAFSCFFPFFFAGHIISSFLHFCGCVHREDQILDFFFFFLFNVLEVSDKQQKKCDKRKAFLFYSDKAVSNTLNQHGDIKKDKI